MNQKVGTAAGEIWSILNENGHQPVAKTKIIKELQSRNYNETIANMAFGWLLREDKLVITEEPGSGKQAGTINVSLKQY